MNLSTHGLSLTVIELQNDVGNKQNITLQHTTMKVLDLKVIIVE